MTHAGPDFLAAVDRAVGWHKWCQAHTKGDTALAPYVDKHNVKAVVAKLAPTLRVAREYLYATDAAQITDAAVARLPARFMMKGAHMSGGVVLVDGDSVKCLKPAEGAPCPKRGPDEPPASYLRRYCAKLLRITYGVRKGEMLYRDVPKGCVLEEQFDVSGGDFQDYKVWVFHGRVLFVHIDSDRFGTHKRNFRTPSWVEIGMADGGGYRYEKNDALRRAPPPFLPALLEHARQLAAPFPYVRADFFVFNGDTHVFSELTFAHDSCKGGRLGFVPKRAEQFYGYAVAHPEARIDPELILQLV